MDPMTRLAGFGTPSISNALESMGCDPADGYIDGTIRLLTEASKPFVGRAVTATMVSSAGGPEEPRVATEEYWRYVADRSGPTVAVVQDLAPVPRGAMFGEVQGRLHQQMGVVGIVTNGPARDLGELGAIGMPLLGAGGCVSHAHARFREIDVPVVVAGLQIHPGDVLHGDRHGIQRIPASVDLGELADVAERIESLEADLFAATTAMSTLDDFLVTWKSVRAAWPSVGAEGEGAI